MPQPTKMKQRLLFTLTQTFRYYKARPTLLSSGAVRNYHGDAASMPTSTGFSITFADGPLESVVAKPIKAATEPKRELEASTTEALEVPKLKNKPKAAKISEHNEPKGNRCDFTSDADLYTKHQHTSTEIEKQENTRGGPSNKHKEGESRLVKALEEAPGPEDHLLQRDYPDARTIDDAGRPRRAQNSDRITKSDKEPPAKSQRPLSTYKEPWQVQKAALRRKFGVEGWNPRKKLSPDTMEGIRALHAQYPDRYTTPVLAEQFAVTPEAIRRILKSKWSSSLDPEKAAEKKERWAKRHDRIWDVKSEIGLRPKRKGSKEVEDPDQFQEELRGTQLLEAHRNA